MLHAWGFCSLLCKSNWTNGHHLVHSHHYGRGKNSMTSYALGFKGAICKWHICSPTLHWLKHVSHMTHPITRGQESVILSAPGKRTGNLEKNTSHSHSGGRMSDLVGTVRTLVLFRKMGNLQSSEQGSNRTLHFKGIIPDDLWEENRRARVLTGRLLRGSRRWQ